MIIKNHDGDDYHDVNDVGDDDNLGDVHDAQGRRRVRGDGERLEVCRDGARPPLPHHLHLVHHYRNLCSARRRTSRYCNIGNHTRPRLFHLFSLFLVVIVMKIGEMFSFAIVIISLEEKLPGAQF